MVIQPLPGEEPLHLKEKVRIKYEKFIPNLLDEIKVTPQIKLHAKAQLFTARDGRMLTKRGKAIHRGVVKDWATFAII